MLDLFLRLPPHVDLCLLTLCALALSLPVLALRRPRQEVEPATRSFRNGYLTTLACGFLLMLSGCGTAPLPAATYPPVPAELMEPPQAPVLLQRPSPSRTPGPTTSRTLLDAGLTERGISG